MKTYNLTLFLCRSLIAFVAFFLSAGVSAESYALVINADNNYSASIEDAKQEIKLLFLKQKSAWANGTTAKPLARPQDSEESKIFLSAILQMSPSEVAQYWLSMKQKTGQTPPREMESSRILLKMISASPDAFALFKQSDVTPTPPGTRVLFVIE